MEFSTENSNSNQQKLKISKKKKIVPLKTKSFQLENADLFYKRKFMSDQQLEKVEKDNYFENSNENRRKDKENTLFKGLTFNKAENENENETIIKNRVPGQRIGREKSERSITKRKKVNSFKINNIFIKYDSSEEGEEDDEQKVKVAKKKTAKKKWRMLLNLVKTINRMKTFEIQKIDSVGEIDNYIKQATIRKRRCQTQAGYKKDSAKKIVSKIEKKEGNVEGKEEIKEEVNEENDEIEEKKCDFQQQKVKDKEMSDLKEDDSEFSKSNDKRITSMFNFKVKEDSVENFMIKLSKQDMIMNIVEKGDVDDMNKVKAYIMQDPKRNIFSKSEKRRYFVNEINSEGYSFIYQATINGHLNYVKLLLDCDADHLMLYGKSGCDKLSILDASVRWNHIKVINYLLFENEYNLTWPKEYIKSAIKIAESNENWVVVKQLKKYMHKLKGGGGCFFLCG